MTEKRKCAGCGLSLDRPEQPCAWCRGLLFLRWKGNPNAPTKGDWVRKP